jgi:hypothetical protein
MIYRPENGDRDRDDNLDAFYKRKQSVKHNQFKGEAEVLHDQDTDAESRHFSYGSKGYGKPSDKPPGSPHIKPDSSTIWDDEPWKDKRD